MSEPVGPLRVAVLCSGGGSNLQALLDTVHMGERPVARVQVVVASRPGVGALLRAERAGVPAAVLNPRDHAPAAFAAHLLRALHDAGVQLVVLAGFLHLLPAPVVQAFRGRIINIHPALLPAFGGAGMYGMHVHRAVLRSGATVSGATVHQVDEEFDRGAILAQWPVPVLPADTPELLAARVLAVEHQLLPAVVGAMARPPLATTPVVGSFALAPAATPPGAAVSALFRDSALVQHSAAV